MSAPRQLQEEMARDLMEAYYRYVCGCELTLADCEAFAGPPWVAVGIKGSRVWVGDLAGYYELPPGMKPTTVSARMARRAQDAQEMGTRLIHRQTENPGTAAEVSYEVWSFTSPSQRLIGALAETHRNGAQVDLISPDEVRERLRTMELAAGTNGSDQALAEAAVRVRQALGL